MAALLTLAASLPVKAIFLADSVFKPVFEYRDGQRTDIPKTTADGQPIFSIRDVPAVIDGNKDSITVQTTSPLEIPAGTIIAPDTEARSTVSVRAMSSKGTSFAELAVTVFCENWIVAGDMSDLI